MTDAQMKLADVTQADREAAADFFECSTFAGRDAFLRGDEDSSDVVQAFAKHRQATEARAQGLVDALEPFEKALGKRQLLCKDDESVTWSAITVGDLRKARQARATWRRT